MDTTTACKALDAFGLAGAQLTPLSGGRIHQTFLAQTGKARFVLQVINQRVLPNARTATENARVLAAHLKLRGLRAPEYLLTADGSPIFTDAAGQQLRAYAYIDGCTPGVQAAAAAGRGWGRFAVAVADFDASALTDPPDDFHHTPTRYAALCAAAAQNPSRAALCHSELEFVQQHSDAFSTLTRRLATGEVPERVIHGDTKATNLLLDASGAPLGVMDLDTLQRGSLLYDFGDAVRSSCGRQGCVHTQALAQFTEGYLSVAGELLTDAERAYLQFAPWLIAMECGMRYLTDFLCGGGYFRAPEGALNKARENFAFARQLR